MIDGWYMVSIDKILDSDNNGICFIQGEDDYMTTVLEGSPEQKDLALKNMMVAKKELVIRGLPWGRCLQISHFQWVRKQGWYTMQRIDIY